MVDIPATVHGNLFIETLSGQVGQAMDQLLR